MTIGCCVGETGLNWSIIGSRNIQCCNIPQTFDLYRTEKGPSLNFGKAKIRTLSKKVRILFYDSCSQNKFFSDVWFQTMPPKIEKKLLIGIQAAIFSASLLKPFGWKTSPFKKIVSKMPKKDKKDKKLVVRTTKAVRNAKNSKVPKPPGKGYRYLTPYSA